jgi:hypothetical protein
MPMKVRWWALRPDAGDAGDVILLFYGNKERTEIMGFIRYRKGVNDLRHLRHNLAAAAEAGALRRADWVRLRSTATDILPHHPALPLPERSTPSPCHPHTLPSSYYRLRHPFATA